MADLLFAGGGRDPNLSWLKETAERIGVTCERIFVDDGELPGFSWTIGGAASIGGRPIACKAAYIRYDVFSQLHGGGPMTAALASVWFSTINAFCVATGVFTLNRSIDQMSASKPAMLALAAEIGFRVPPTLISNIRDDVMVFAGAADCIGKPVNGGSYIMTLKQAIDDTAWENGRSPTPAIIQPKFDYPERRIYRVGNEYFAFDIKSQTLDSRLDNAMTIEPFPIDQLPAGIIDKLRTLTDRLRCDFCAIDMKTDAATGDLVFLELNNGPMIKAYDRAGGGAMGEAMVRYLLAGAG